MNLEDAVGLHSLAKVTMMLDNYALVQKPRVVDSKMGGYPD